MRSRLDPRAWPSRTMLLWMAVAYLLIVYLALRFGHSGRAPSEPQAPGIG